MVMVLIVFFTGLAAGIAVGAFIQRGIYDSWFKKHCYFCCNKFNSDEDAGKTAAFETDLTASHKAHLICWERNLFSEHDAETEC